MADLNRFLWGVATSGYQSEGGFNGPGQPQNNWSLDEQRGRVMPTGTASEFWDRYPEDFRRCRDLGLNAFRLSLEWARIQPSTSPVAASAPAFDTQALDAYAERLACCLDQGLEPLVTLHHFTHPAWLGLDAWLSEDTLARFADYVRITVSHINRRLIDRHHLRPIRWYITLNEPNILVLNSYFSRQFPSGSAIGPKVVLRAYSHLLAAHIKAYERIHDLYESEGWPRPQVTLNTYCSDLYWSEKIIWDLLLMRQRQIAPADLKAYVYDKAEAMEAALASASLPFQRNLPFYAGRFARFLANLSARSTFDPDQMQRFLSDLFASPYPRCCDYLAIDYYDPFIAHTFRLPSFSDFEFETEGLRSWFISGITSKWWDWRSLPQGLHFFCRFYNQDLGIGPIVIAENGMALRRKPDNSVATRRVDQLSRSRFLEAHLEQVDRLRQESVPLAGYFHWSLTDNYEWGSFTPRFGLYTLDYTHSAERLVEDHLGDRPSETYAGLIRSFQEKEDIKLV